MISQLEVIDLGIQVYFVDQLHAFSSTCGVKGNHGFPLLDEDTIIMEIKAPGKKPDWLQAILDKHGLEEQKFSKYSCAYHKSQGLDYGPRPAQEKGAAAYV